MANVGWTEDVAAGAKARREAERLPGPPVSSEVSPVAKAVAELVGAEKGDLSPAEHENAMGRAKDKTDHAWALTNRLRHGGGQGAHNQAAVAHENAARHQRSAPEPGKGARSAEAHEAQAAAHRESAGRVKRGEGSVGGSSDIARDERGRFTAKSAGETFWPADLAAAAKKEMPWATTHDESPESNDPLGNANVQGEQVPLRLARKAMGLATALRRGEPVDKASLSHANRLRSEALEATDRAEMGDVSHAEAASAHESARQAFHEAAANEKDPEVKRSAEARAAEHGRFSSRHGKDSAKQTGGGSGEFNRDEHGRFAAKSVGLGISEVGLGISEKAKFKTPVELHTGKLNDAIRRFNNAKTSSKPNKVEEMRAAAEEAGQHVRNLTAAVRQAPWKSKGTLEQAARGHDRLVEMHGDVVRALGPRNEGNQEAHRGHNTSQQAHADDARGLRDQARDEQGRFAAKSAEGDLDEADGEAQKARKAGEPWPSDLAAAARGQKSVREAAIEKVSLGERVRAHAIAPEQTERGRMYAGAVPVQEV